MNGLAIVKDLREQLDHNGYKDVEVKLIGDVPWSRGSDPNNDISQAHRKGGEMMASVGLGGGRGRGGRGGRGGGGAADQPAPESAPVASNGNHSLFPISDVDSDSEPTGGYWPSYLFTDGEVGQKVGTVSLPMGSGGGGGGGGGGRNHAANEYYTVEAKGHGGGLANSEKNVVATIYSYAQITTVPIRPKGVTPKQ